VEQEELAIARQQHGKHVSAAMNKHATTEKLLEAEFSIWSMSRLYSKDPFDVPTVIKNWFSAPDGGA
jgi:hypothetical protein